MSRVSDYQRGKLYAAENAVFHHSMDPEMDSLSAVREYADKVIASDYWGKAGGWTRVKVADGRGRRAACYKPQRREVCFPVWSRSRWIIIHELSHCLTHKTSGNTGAWHGTHFAGHYLCLVEEMLGRGLAAALADSFQQHGVRWYGDFTR